MTTEDNNDDLNKRHHPRIQRRKAIVDVKIAVATDVRGILLVSTGNGKGKSSSNFGMVMRVMGHDVQVSVVQLVKGAIPTGEEHFLRRFSEQCSFCVTGEGYTWETQDRTRDIEKMQAAWARARGLLSDPTVGLALLDELSIALKYHYLDVQVVLTDLRARPSVWRVVITGRGAPPELIETTDTVIDMTLAEHAFPRDIQAQPGAELW